MTLWNPLRDNLVRVRAPVEIEPSGTRDPLTAATVEATLYDAAADGVVGAEAAAGATTLEVSNARRLRVNDQVRAFLDNGDRFEPVVSAIDVSAGTIDVDTAVPAGRTLREGAAIARRLGLVYVLQGFNLGAADPSTKDWGYQQTIPRGFAELRPGMRLRIEVEITEGTANALEWIERTVSGPGRPVP